MSIWEENRITRLQIPVVKNQNLPFEIQTSKSKFSEKLCSSNAVSVIKPFPPKYSLLNSITSFNSQIDIFCTMSTLYLINFKIRFYNFLIYKYVQDILLSIDE